MAKHQIIASLAIGFILLAGGCSRGSTPPGAANAILDEPPAGLVAAAETMARQQLKSSHSVTFPPGAIVRRIDAGFRVRGVLVERDKGALLASYEYCVVLVAKDAGFELASVSLSNGLPPSTIETMTSPGGLWEDDF